MQAEGQEFGSQIEQLLRWLQSTKETVERQAKISCLEDRLPQQSQEFDAIYSDVLNHEGEIHYAKAKGKDVLKKNHDSHLESKMIKVQELWEPLLKVTKDRRSKLDHAVDVLKQYKLAAKTVNSFIDEAEKQLKQFKDEKPPLDKLSYEKHMREIQVIAV